MFLIPTVQMDITNICHCLSKFSSSSLLLRHVVSCQVATVKFADPLLQRVPHCPTAQLCNHYIIRQLALLKGYHLDVSISTYPCTWDIIWSWDGWSKFLIQGVFFTGPALKVLSMVVALPVLESPPEPASRILRLRGACVLLENF